MPKTRVFEATYDSAFRAFVDSTGAMHIVETEGRVDVPGSTTPVITLASHPDRVVTIPPERAQAIVADLDHAADSYGDIEINSVQHWILARAFERAEPT